MICLLVLCKRHLSHKLDVFLLLTDSNPVSNLPQSEGSDRVHSAERTTSWRRSPRGRTAYDPGPWSQADDNKRRSLGGSLMEQAANLDRKRIPYGCIRRQSCSSPLAQDAGNDHHLPVDGRCPSDRTAPRTALTQSHWARLGPFRLGGYRTTAGPSTTRASSSGEPVGGWPTSTVRSGDTARVTATDLSGYEIDKAVSPTRTDVSSVSRRFRSRPTAQSEHTASDTN